jgi:hypothetical protein
MEQDAPVSDASRQEAAENAIADKLFGPAETPQEDVQEEYTPDPEPVVEGDEAEPEEIEAAEPTEPSDEMVEVEFDGTLIEAPKNVAEALMRQNDYTQKTQEVSTQRKTVEVQLGEVEQLKAQYNFAAEVQNDIMEARQQELLAEQLHQYLRDNVGSLTSVDIEKIKIAAEDARMARDEKVQSVTQRQTEFQQAQEQNRKELLTKSTEVLRQNIPGWDANKDTATREYAQTLGFTEAEVSEAALIDPRYIATLYKAQQYDALKAGATPAVQRVQKAASVKPRKKMTKATGDKLNLRKKMKSNLSPQDKADALGQSIAERFNM